MTVPLNLESIGDTEIIIKFFFSFFFSLSSVIGMTHLFFFVDSFYLIWAFTDRYTLVKVCAQEQQLAKTGNPDSPY